MKKIVMAGAAIITLAACSTTTPVVVQTVTAPAPVSTVQELSKDDQYLAKVHSQNNTYVEAISDADLINLGSQVCPILNSGVTVKEMAAQLVADLSKNGATDPQEYAGLGAIVGAAISTYCPQYSSQVNAL